MEEVKNNNPYYHGLMNWFRDISHRGFLLGAPNALIGKAKNRSCGDEVSLQLVFKHGKIVSARYDGESCAISLASSSALCKMIEGNTPAEAAALLDALRKASCEGIAGCGMDDFVVLHEHSRRHRCATLVTDACEEILGSL